MPSWIRICRILNPATFNVPMIQVIGEDPVIFGISGSVLFALVPDIKYNFHPTFFYYV